MNEGAIVQESELESRYDLVRAVGTPEDDLEEARIIAGFLLLSLSDKARPVARPDPVFGGGFDGAGGENVGERPFVSTLGKRFLVDVDVVNHHLELSRFGEVEGQVG